MQKFRNPDQKNLRNSAIPPKPRYLFFQKKRARFEIDFSKKKKKKKKLPYFSTFSYVYVYERMSIEQRLGENTESLELDLRRYTYMYKNSYERDAGVSVLVGGLEGRMGVDR